MNLKEIRLHGVDWFCQKLIYETTFLLDLSVDGLLRYDGVDYIHISEHTGQ